MGSNPNHRPTEKMERRSRTWVTGIALGDQVSVSLSAMVTKNIVPLYIRAVSSLVERFVDIEEVAGPIPVLRTKII